MTDEHENRNVDQHDDVRGKPLTRNEERNQLIRKLTEKIGIPEDHEVDRKGVTYLAEGIRICDSPIWVSHLIRSANNREWCPVVTGFNRNGEIVDIVLPYELIYGRPSQLAAALASCGFRVRLGCEKKVAEYLNAFVNVPRLVRARGVGWVNSEEGVLAFNLRDRTIGGADVFDFSLLKNARELLAMQAKGTLKGWKKGVAFQAKDHPLLRFGLALALTGPLLRLLDGETFGVHACGATSTGKSTMALVACSVWGAANRPGAGPTLMYSFNQTVNAIESLCQSRNDTTIVFDEIGSHDGGSFTTVIYRIAGGVQKGRLGRDGNLRETSEWQFTILTTGERSVIETLVEDTREGRVKAGQTVRLVNLQTDNRILIVANEVEATDLVLLLRSAMSENYGTAGPAFVERLIAALNSGELDIPSLRAAWDEAAEELRIPGLENHHFRVLRHLALVAVAGQAAALLGILPFTAEEIMESVSVARDMYLTSPDRMGDAAREVENIKEYIEENVDRFRHYSKDSEPVRGQVGYQHRFHGETFYLFTQLGLRRAAKVRNLKGALRLLEQKDLLHINNPGKHQAKVPFIDFTQSRLERTQESRRNEGPRRQIAFYAVSERLLQSDGSDYHPSPKGAVQFEG